MDGTSLFDSVGWVNAGGLFLLCVGIGFIIAEFFLPAFGLFGFSGVAALIIGAVILDQTGYITAFDMSMPLMLSLAGIGILLSGLGGWLTWRLYRRPITTGPESLVGEPAEIIEWDGKSGRVRVQGDVWQAYADDTFTNTPETNTFVCRVEKLKLKIRIQNSN